MQINYQDSINFLSTMTLRKITNAVCLYTSYYFSKITRYSRHFGMPISISIEPTTSCNLKCPECPSGLRSFTRATGSIEKSLFETLINELHKDLMNLIFYFQGEPYIHPDFLNMVKFASKKNLYTTTSTNGHFLNEENAKETVLSGLNRLIISVDGTTQNTYEQYRKNGDLSIVLKGAENVIRQKSLLNSNTPHIIFQFLVVRPNEHQIEDIKSLAIEMGVNEVRIKTAQIYDYKDGNILLPLQEKYSRYKKDIKGNYILKRKHNKKRNCWKMWHSTVMTWDGKFLPCCFDKDADYTMGNYNSSGKFTSIWSNSEYKGFRKKIVSSRNDIEICSNCTEGINIWQ